MAAKLSWSENQGAPVVNCATGAQIIAEGDEYFILERCGVSRHNSALDVRRIPVGKVGHTPARQWIDGDWRDVIV